MEGPGRLCGALLLGSGPAAIRRKDSAVMYVQRVVILYAYLPSKHAFVTYAACYPAG